MSIPDECLPMHLIKDKEIEMVSDRRILFSVNDYDLDGEIVEKGIYWHFGDTRVKVAVSVEDLKCTIEGLIEMVEEIQLNYCDDEGNLIGEV